MDNEQKFLLITILTIVLGICLFTFIVCFYSYKSTQQYVSNGYTQVSIQGISGTVWQKLPEVTNGQ